MVNNLNYQNFKMELNNFREKLNKFTDILGEALGV